MYALTFTGRAQHVVRLRPTFSGTVRGKRALCGAVLSVFAHQVSDSAAWPVCRRCQVLESARQ